MDQASHFGVDSSQITDEVIDDEVIIVNLENGNYYSLVAAAADIWLLLKSGITYGETTRLIQSRYSGDPSLIQQGIEAFVGELVAQGLLTPSESPVETGTSVELPAKAALSPFETPKLEVYVDMQKMLLLDPIHEVDESGWPSIDPNRS